MAGDHDSRARRAALLRLGLFAALLVVVFVTATATGNVPSAREIRNFGDDLGPLAPVLFVPVFVALNFLVAWTILAGATGLLFGIAAGTPVALAGVTLAALSQMAVSRYLAGAQVGRLLPERVARLEGFLERRGAVAIMYSRIVPLLPYGAVNYASGLTRLRFRDMTLGTVVGAAPKVFGYVALGGSLTNLDAPEAKVAIGLLVALALGGALVVRRQVTA
jgi:uncharacterized membrane protein YdjX (TVP38/TMEM64 family)